jgi:hypothetical protein
MVSSMEAFDRYDRSRCSPGATARAQEPASATAQTSKPPATLMSLTGRPRQRIVEFQEDDVRGSQPEDLPAGHRPVYVRVSRELAPESIPGSIVMYIE